MTPYHSDEWLTVYQGDCRAVLASLPAESVHCVVTSPPYWGLRDYGDAGQLGLEPTPEEYVANLVAVFREVRRVLRSDGTVWLNLGDSYIAGQGGRQSAVGEMPAKPLYSAANPHKRTDVDTGSWGERDATAKMTPARGTTNLKPKDLAGVPWRVAFALQADGWYLRSDIIWSKPNPMPESVTDRPTKSHEYVFMLSKSSRYFWDADAVREAVAREWDESNIGPANRINTGVLEGRVLGRATNPHGGLANTLPNPAGRNIRSVWQIATQPYPGAHFATFPRKLVEPCIKAGTSERGVCPECGAPWVRVVEREKNPDRDVEAQRAYYAERTGRTDGAIAGPAGLVDVTRTTGWRPSCACIRQWAASDDLNAPNHLRPIPATVLDIFAGSGTTGLVAQSLSRRAILIDLNGDYLVQAMGRNRDIPLGLAG